LFQKKNVTDFPAHEKWEEDWEGEIKVGEAEDTSGRAVTTFRTWLPYILIVLILLIGRLEVFGLTTILKFWSLTWRNIFGTSVSRGITLSITRELLPLS